MAKRFVNDSFWTDPEVKPLSFQTKGLFLYFITNPHGHISGIYYLPLSTVQEETGLLPKDLKKELYTLSIDYKHILYHPDFSVIWVRKMFQHQVFNDKIRTNIENHLLTLHKCPLIKNFLEYYDTLLIQYPYSLSQKNSGTSIVLGVVSSKKDEEEDKLVLPPTPLKGEEVSNPKDPYFNFNPEDFQNLWNLTVGNNGFAKCHGLDIKENNRPNTKTRRELIGALLQERRCPGYWQMVFAKVAASPFLQGENDKKWKANIDFVIRPGNHIKIMEGKYDDRAGWTKESWDLWFGK